MRTLPISAHWSCSSCALEGSVGSLKSAPVEYEMETTFARGLLPQSARPGTWMSTCISLDSKTLHTELLDSGVVAVRAVERSKEFVH